MTYPLTQTQIGIYVTCMNNQETGTYNIDTLYHLHPSIDIPRLAKALETVVEAHPYLKSRIINGDNGDLLFQDYINEPFHTTILSVSSIDDVSDRLGAEYDLLHDRLFRMEIYRTANGNFLYVDFHHIIFDGMSYLNFIQELSRAYDGEPLVGETLTTCDIAMEEKALRATTRHDTDREWYTNEYSAAAEVESMPLPDIYGNTQTHYHKEIIPLHIDADALQQLCQRAGVTEGMVFTTAFGYTLSRYSASDEVLFNTIYHGRNNKDTRQAFTMAVKTLPVYQNISTTPSVLQLLQQTAVRFAAHASTTPIPMVR